MLDGAQLTFLFFSIFLGSFLVTFNIKVLRGQTSFFQSVSTVGYCICPLFLAAMLLQLMKFLQVQNKIIKMVLIALATVWCLIGNFLLMISSRQ